MFDRAALTCQFSDRAAIFCVDMFIHDDRENQSLAARLARHCAKFFYGKLGVRVAHVQTSRVRVSVRAGNSTFSVTIRQLAGGGAA